MSKSLKLLDLFQPFFRWMKIDYPVMRRILEIKLIMDQRRTPTILASQMGKEPKGNQFLKSLGIYVLYSLALIIFVVIKQQYMFQMSLVFGLTMFLLMTTMIADFSSVLLDVRDKMILHTKPINSRTVNAAKLIHITYYMAMITVAFTILPAIISIGVQGLGFFLIFILEIFLLVLFIMTFTALIYLLILRVFGSEQLKDIINYVQIVLSIGVVIGYQVLIRAYDFVDLQFAYDFAWWHVLLPPIWFAAPFDLFLSGNTELYIIVLSILTLIMPIVSLLIYVWLMPSFERNLQKLAGESEIVKKQKGFLANLVCFNQAERKYFRFSSLMMSREREFKLKVYPILGMALVFPFIFILNAIFAGENLENSRTHYNIYFTCLTLAAGINMLEFSKDHKGSWIFHVIPLQDGHLFYKAALKAFLVKLFLPIYLIVSGVIIYLFSWTIWIDLLIAMVTSVLISLLTFKLMSRVKYPFSRPIETAQEGGQSVKVLLVMLVVGVFVLIHFLSSLVPYGEFGYFALLVILTILSWTWIFRDKSLV